MAHYIDTWHVIGHLPSGAILTCYGLTETTANATAALIEHLCVKVVCVHTIKPTPRGLWKREEFTRHPYMPPK